MKTHRLITLLALSLSLSSQLQAQGGSLTPPPGPPAPVMHTLTEIFDTAQQASTTATAINDLVTAQGTQITNIEANMGSQAGTPINTLPGDATATHIIIAPGSYHLTSSINGNPGKVGIRVEAVNVTINLNGFNLQATAGATKGIQVNSAGGPVVIRNGFMRFWTEQAIYIPNASEFTIEDVTITNVTGRAVEVAGFGTIKRVNIKNAVEYGIYAPSVAQLLLQDCRIEDITTAVAGIHAPKAHISRCIVTNISGSGTHVSGINSLGGLAKECYVSNIYNASSQTASGIFGSVTVTDSTVSDVQTLGGSSPTNYSAGIWYAKLVSGCRVQLITDAYRSYGIGADIVTGSSVSNCGIDSTESFGVTGNNVTDCNVDQVAMVGISVYDGGTAKGNTVVYCAVGIKANYMASIMENTIHSCSQSGIKADLSGSHTITSNTISGLLNGTSVGIHCGSANGAFVERNNVQLCVTGFKADAGSTAIFLRNIASGCTTNFSITAGMTVVTPAALGTNPNANISK